MGGFWWLLLCVWIRHWLLAIAAPLLNSISQKEIASMRPWRETTYDQSAQIHVLTYAVRGEGLVCHNKALGRESFNGCESVLNGITSTPQFSGSRLCTTCTVPGILCKHSHILGRNKRSLSQALLHYHWTRSCLFKHKLLDRFLRLTVLKRVSSDPVSSRTTPVSHLTDHTWAKCPGNDIES